MKSALATPITAGDRKLLETLGAKHAGKLTDEQISELDEGIWDHDWHAEHGAFSPGECVHRVIHGDPDNWSREDAVDWWESVLFGYDYEAADVMGNAQAMTAVVTGMIQAQA